MNFTRHEDAFMVFLLIRYFPISLIEIVRNQRVLAFKGSNGRTLTGRFVKERFNESFFSVITRAHPLHRNNTDCGSNPV